MIGKVKKSIKSTSSMFGAEFIRLFKKKSFLALMLISSLLILINILYLFGSGTGISKFVDKGIDITKTAQYGLYTTRSQYHLPDKNKDITKLIDDQMEVIISIEDIIAAMPKDKKKDSYYNETLANLEYEKSKLAIYRYVRDNKVYTEDAEIYANVNDGKNQYFSKQNVVQENMIITLLLAFFVAIILLSTMHLKDEQTGELRLQLIRPSSRLKIFYVKFFTVFIIASSIITISVVISELYAIRFKAPQKDLIGVINGNYAFRLTEQKAIFLTYLNAHIALLFVMSTTVFVMALSKNYIISIIIPIFVFIVARPTSIFAKSKGLSFLDPGFLVDLNQYFQYTEPTNDFSFRRLPMHNTNFTIIFSLIITYIIVFNVVSSLINKYRDAN